LCNLLNLLDPTISLDLGGDTKSRCKAFTEAVTSVDYPFLLLPQEICSVLDLETFDTGLKAEQIAKQKRIVRCLISLAQKCPDITIRDKDYMGPRLDEATLGVLSANDFFGELTILPIENGWKHTRTVVAVKNSLLYMLTKRSVDKVCVDYPALKFKLQDHAEDLEKSEKLKNAFALRQANMETGESSKTSKKKKIRLQERDPQAAVTARLDHQDAKLAKVSPSHLETTSSCAIDTTRLEC